MKKNNHIIYTQDGSQLYYCQHCKSYKHKQEFGRLASNTYRDCTDNICKKCRVEFTLKSRKKNSSNCQKEESLLFTLKARMQSAKIRAAQKNIPFDLTIEDLLSMWNAQNEKCAISGIKMECKSESRSTNYNVVSIDRIDSTKGYTKNNVWLVCWAINSMKNNMDLMHFINLCSRVSSNNKMFN